MTWHFRGKIGGFDNFLRYASANFVSNTITKEFSCYFYES